MAAALFSLTHSLSSEQNGQHFADDFFKFNLLNETTEWHHLPYLGIKYYISFSLRMGKHIGHMPVQLRLAAKEKTTEETGIWAKSQACYLIVA